MLKSDAKDYVIFYDIDGVLTSPRVQLSHYIEDVEIDSIFDPVAIQLFNKICIMHDFNVSLVCVSSWKNGKKGTSLESYMSWNRMLRNAGFLGDIPRNGWTTTPSGEYINDRADQILRFLDDKPYVKDIIIFDDSDIGYSDNPHLAERYIRTDSYNGITFNNVKDAIEIVENWRKEDEDI